MHSVTKEQAQSLVRSVYNQTFLKHCTTLKHFPYGVVCTKHACPECPVANPILCSEHHPRIPLHLGSGYKSPILGAMDYVVGAG